MGDWGVGGMGVVVISRSLDVCNVRFVKYTLQCVSFQAPTSTFNALKRRSAFLFDSVHRNTSPQHTSSTRKLARHGKTGNQQGKLQSMLLT